MAIGLTVDERRKLLDKMAAVMVDPGFRDWEIRVRDCVAMMFGLEAGLRTSEVLKIRISDVWFGDGARPWLDLPANFNKKCKAGQIFLSRRITEALGLYIPIRKSWLRVGEEDAPLIVSRPRKNDRGLSMTKVQIFHMVRFWAKLAGIRNFRFHDLRHTFATFAMAVDNSNLRVVQDLMRHRSLASTQIYLHPTHAQLQNVIEKAFNGEPKETVV